MEDKEVKRAAIPPAFPVQEWNADGTPAHLSVGIDRLEYFTAKAMQGLIQAAWSNPEPAKRAYVEWSAEQPPDQSGSFGDWIASTSVSYAVDALRLLVRARNLTPTDQP